MGQSSRTGIAVRVRRLGAIALAGALAATAGAAFAAPEIRIERSEGTTTPGTNGGVEGYWIEYTEWTFEEGAQKFDELAAGLSAADRAAALAAWKASGKAMTVDEMKAFIAKYDSRALKDAYKSIYGYVPDDAAIGKLQKKIADGQLTLEQAKAYIQETKTLSGWGATGPYGAGRTLYVKAIDRVLSVTRWAGSAGEKKSWLRVSTQETTTSYTRYYNTASSLVEAGKLARLIELLDLGIAPPTSQLAGGHYAFSRNHPYTIAFTRDALLAKLKEVFKLGIDTYSPIALDLNNDGKIGVTGKSTAAVRKEGNDFVAEGSVLFDLRGAGVKERYEWLDARSGDGFLILDKDGAVTRAAESGADIDGTRLFGNVVGYDNGFEKLAIFTSGLALAAGDFRQLPEARFKAIVERKAATGKDLEQLKVWIDANGDAKVQPTELKTLGSLGITEIGLRPDFKKNAHGETVIESYFIQNGIRRMTEDVWFASEPPAAAGEQKGGR